MRVKRYKLKENLTKEDLLSYGFRTGGSWIINDSDIFNSYILRNPRYRYREEHKDTVEVHIAFKKDINDWNDYDNILVFDTDFGQPVGNFYNYFDKDTRNESVQMLFSAYNELLDSLPFLTSI